MPIDPTEMRADILDSMASAVLRSAEKAIKALRCDVSAIAPEHVTGYEAGFREAKKAMLDAISD